MEKKDLGLEIRSLSNLLKKTLDDKINLDKTMEITGMQARILKYMYNNINKEPIFQKDVEKIFQTKRSTATNILQLMEKNGLVTREAISDDARLKQLILTEKAIEVGNNITEMINELEGQMGQCMTEEERNLFLELIDRMKNNIKNGGM